MRSLKSTALMLTSALLLSACTNYDRPQDANLGICKKLRTEMNAPSHFHNPNATHNTHQNRVALMQQYKKYECEDRSN